MDEVKRFWKNYDDVLFKDPTNIDKFWSDFARLSWETKHMIISLSDSRQISNIPGLSSFNSIINESHWLRWWIVLQHPSKPSKNAKIERIRRIGQRLPPEILSKILNFAFSKKYCSLPKEPLHNAIQWANQ